MVADGCRRLGAGLLAFEGQQNRTQALRNLSKFMNSITNLVGITLCSKLVP